MSMMPHAEPECTRDCAPSVELVIKARIRDLGDGLTVRRLLPSVARRMVGPFIFVDHMGPVQLGAGQGMDVRPHPHLNLATVTYLFDGEFLHRDSLGTEQLIHPGAINWMNAGRGIAHSERSPAAERKSGAHAHGMQLWVALTTAEEQSEPSFQHCAADTIPTVEQPGARLRVLAGSAYGVVAPARVLSPLFYVEARIDRAATLDLPGEHRRRAAYVVEGVISVEDRPYRPGEMLVFHEGVAAQLHALEPAHVMMLGGAPLDGERHIYWNFVSSSLQRIEQAKLDWRERRFAAIPGDDSEFIPLPE